MYHYKYAFFLCINPTFQFRVKKFFMYYINFLKSYINFIKNNIKKEAIVQ